MPFLVRPLIPRPFRTASFRAYVLNALRDIQRDVLTDLQATVATWKHPVSFTVGISYKSDAVLVLWTDDYVWNILNSGTAQRFARFTPDFVPKTKPRVIGSFAGRGRALPSRVSTGSIMAREWSKVIAENNSERLKQLIAAAIYKYDC